MIFFPFDFDGYVSCNTTFSEVSDANMYFKLQHLLEKGDIKNNLKFFVEISPKVLAPPPPTIYVEQKNLKKYNLYLNRKMHSESLWPFSIVAQI